MPEVIVLPGNIQGGVPLVRDAFFNPDPGQSRYAANPADIDLLPKRQLVVIQVHPTDLGEDAAVGDQHAVRNHPTNFFAEDGLADLDGLSGLVLCP